MSADRTDASTDGGTAGSTTTPTTVSDLQREADRVRRALEPDPRLVGGVFGLAWLVGYGALWLGITGRGPDWITPTVGGVTLAVGLVIAMATFAVHTAMRTSGVRGPSAVSGAMYSVAWPLAFGGLFLVLSGAGRAGMPDETFSLLWATLAPFTVGALMLMGSAIWRDRVQYVTGAWIIAAAGVAAIVGYPTTNLVISLAGGGGLLAAGAAYGVIQRYSPAVATGGSGS